MLKPESCFDRNNRIKQDDQLLFILCILSKKLLDLRPDYFGIVSTHHKVYVCIYLLLQTRHFIEFVRILSHTPTRQPPTLFLRFFKSILINVVLSGCVMHKAGCGGRRPKENAMADSTVCACACGGAEVSEAELLKRLDAVLEEHREQPGGLIPVLQIAQAIFGYLPETALQRIADAFQKPFSEVAGVVSFYSFFSTVPRGRHLVRVCLGTACYVRGGREVLDALKKKLGIDVGQTTADRRFSLAVGRCFGACGMGPVVMVDDTVHQRVKSARVAEMLEEHT